MGIVICEKAFFYKNNVAPNLSPIKIEISFNVIYFVR